MSTRPALTDDAKPTARFARWGFYVFLAALLLAPLLGGTPVGPDYAVAAWGGDSMSGVLRGLVLTAALLTTVLSAPYGAERTPAYAAARVGVYGTAFWVALSLIVHSRGFTSPVYLFAMLPETLNWLIYALAFALAARYAGEDRANLPRMAIMLLAGGVCCAVVGIVSFGGVPGAERVAHRESATFFSPNFAGGFCALLLPLALAIFLEAGVLIAVVASASATGLLFAMLMMTGSRAGLVLAGVGLVIPLTYALRGGKRTPWGRVGAAAAILLLFGMLFGAPMLGRVVALPGTNSAVGGAALPATTSGGGTADDHSGAFRKETWRGSLAMANANPIFGAGPGTFPFTYPRYARVGWTGQAHSSYLQLASESGYPALLALIVGVCGAVITRVRRGRESPGTNTAPSHSLLVPALLGGAVAALGRSVFDSEWMLLACGVPFFAILGMLVGTRETAPLEPEKYPPAARWGATLFLAASLALTLVLRTGQAERDRLTLQARTDPNETTSLAKEAAGRVSPADPQLYALAGDPATAAFLSPNGRRLYQLARLFERDGDWDKATKIFGDARKADPNNLQTLKALAETQTKGGDTTGSLFTYLDVIQVAEGPAGKIRALPELVDTLPAFAYVAVAEDSLKRGDLDEANARFATAQRIIEDYSRTAPPYQIAELATLGGNADARRAEVRSLYTDRVLRGRREAMKRLGKSSDQEVGATVEAQTLERLDKFVSLTRPEPAPTSGTPTP